MTTRKRPAPSFRPNLKLSHFVYRGPERRHYAVDGKVAAEATGHTDALEPESGQKNGRGAGGRKR